MPPQAGMNVSLTKQLQSFVNQRVKKGRYQSASEVVRAGLRLLQENEREYERWKKDTRAKIAEGAKQARDGKLLDGEAVFDKIEQELLGVKRKSRRRKSA